jgi:hypothetical protein
LIWRARRKAELAEVFQLGGLASRYGRVLGGEVSKVNVFTAKVNLRPPPVPDSANAGMAARIVSLWSAIGIILRVRTCAKILFAAIQRYSVYMVNFAPWFSHKLTMK